MEIIIIIITVSLGVFSIVMSLVYRSKQKKAIYKRKAEASAPEYINAEPTKSEIPRPSEPEPRYRISADEPAPPGFLRRASKAFNNVF